MVSVMTTVALISQQPSTPLLSRLSHALHQQTIARTLFTQQTTLLTLSHAMDFHARMDLSAHSTPAAAQTFAAQTSCSLSGDTTQATSNVLQQAPITLISTFKEHPTVSFAQLQNS